MQSRRLLRPPDLSCQNRFQSSSLPGEKRHSSIAAPPLCLLSLVVQVLFALASEYKVEMIVWMRWEWITLKSASSSWQLRIKLRPIPFYFPTFNPAPSTLSSLEDPFCWLDENLVADDVTDEPYWQLLEGTVHFGVNSPVNYMKVIPRGTWYKIVVTVFFRSEGLLLNAGNTPLIGWVLDPSEMKYYGRASFPPPHNQLSEGPVQHFRGVIFFSYAK